MLLKVDMHEAQTKCSPIITKLDVLSNMK